MIPEIKICGITNFEDANNAVTLGAKFLGLNFFADSPRFLSIIDAVKLSQKIKNQLPKINLVGVFVNEQKSFVTKTAELCSLDTLQFHGNESSDFCESFSQKVWRAFRVRNENSLKDLQYFSKLDGIMLDAYRQDQFGGTGQTFNWQLIESIRDQIPNLILSGGISSENITDAIKKLHPNIVDVCSGVESIKNSRRKDFTKLKKLFEAVLSTR